MLERARHFHLGSFALTLLLLSSTSYAQPRLPDSTRASRDQYLTSVTFDSRGPGTFQSLSLGGARLFIARTAERVFPDALSCICRKVDRLNQELLKNVFPPKHQVNVALIFKGGAAGAGLQYHF